MGDSKTGAWKVQGDPGVYCGAKNTLKPPEGTGPCQKDTGPNLKEFPVAEVWKQTK